MELVSPNTYHLISAYFLYNLNIKSQKKFQWRILINPDINLTEIGKCVFLSGEIFLNSEHNDIVTILLIFKKFKQSFLKLFVDIFI